MTLETLFTKKQTNRTSTESHTLPCILDYHDLAEGVQKRKRNADITNKKSKEHTKKKKLSETIW